MRYGPLRAGLLRHTVTVRAPQRTSDGHGGFVNAWTTLGSFAAQVEGLDGREALLASAMQGISSFRITVRWNQVLVSGDCSSWQAILSDGRELNVRSISDPEGKRVRMEILADSGSVVADSSA